MRPLPYPKKIDIKEKIYYHYKIDPATYALYDSELNTPIAYGSFNFVSSTTSKLPPSSTIFYYEIDRQTGWKMKGRYNPQKQIVETSVAKKSVERSEEKKKG